tara:strand:- start:29 stop:517 length:489 start_codon:yes stop_codon:yes gene_type:complete
MTSNNNRSKRCVKGFAKPASNKIAKHYGVERYDCMACGVEGVQVDAAHIRPLQYNGSNEIENIHLLCRPCHAESENLWGKEYEIWLELKKEFYSKGAYNAVYCLDAFNRFLILDRIIRSAKNEPYILFDENYTLPEEDSLNKVMCFDMWAKLNGDLVTEMEV